MTTAATNHQLISLTRDTVHHVIRIQQLSYPSDYVESEQAFLKMIDNYPLGCFLLQIIDEESRRTQIGGYIVSHPHVRGQVQTLDQGCDIVTGNENCWYIHDCCLDPSHRGRGFARKMVEHVERLAKAKGMDIICLVSVQGTYPFWQRRGYQILEKIDYGGLEAYKMEKQLLHNEMHSRL